MTDKFTKAVLLFVAFVGFVIAVALDYVQNGARSTENYYNDGE